MFNIFRSWRNSSIVKLLHGQDSWNVVVHRKKKMCRFGLGWDAFTKANELFVGQKVRFDYVVDRTFKVSLMQ